MDAPPIPDAQQIRDEEHLRLLSIFHYVLGGLHCAFAALFVLQMLFVMGMIAIPIFGGQNPDVLPPVIVGLFMVVFFSIFILLWLALGIATIYSGRLINKRKQRTFSMVVAGVNCMMFPFGTALGVFTFIVLGRDSVRRAYETNTPPVRI